MFVIFFVGKVFPATNYVWTGGTHQPPFTSWETAANDIQSAVDEAFDGDVVLVTNGLYNTGGIVTPGHNLTNRILVSKSIILKSVNGPETTFIVGKAYNGTNGPGAIRGVYLTNNVFFAGFSVSNGHTDLTGDLNYDQSGGGLFLHENCIVSNCVIVGNRANYGGGVECYKGGKLEECLILGNNSVKYGGGIECYHAGKINNCIIISNKALYGSAVMCGRGGEVNNCQITGNYAIQSGGIYCVDGGLVNSCLLTENISKFGGGIYNRA